MGAAGDHYRKEAARARRWSAETSDPTLRQQLLKLAETYMELAHQLDGLKDPELDKLEEPDQPSKD